jgi:uncharacterized protein (TIGR02265 family)
MRETWVRGIFFRQVLDYIKHHRGLTSYELLGMEISDFRPEEKYPFARFGELLSKVRLISPGEDDCVAKMSRDLMNREASWKSLFRRMDPKNVFTSTQRQEGRHQLADYEPAEASDGQVVIRMKMWSENRDHQDLWAEFYRGRLEGILDLMGRKGSVKLVREFGDGGAFTYTISWN